MAPDDRDRTFEKALARHLRADAQTEAAAQHPDAEILAAYHARLLAPEQMISWKSHIAGCAQCQQILAHLEATDELLADVSQEVHDDPKVLTMPETDLPQLAHVALKTAAPPESQTAAAARWSRRLKALPGANWRWLAPAGALAAGLLLWISFHEANPPQFQMAKNQQPAAPSPAPMAQSQSLPPAKKEAASNAVPSPAPARVEVQTDKLTGVSRGALLQNKPGARSENDARPTGVVGGMATEEKELQKQTVPSAVSPAPPAEISALSRESKDRPGDHLDVAANQGKSAAPPKAKSVASGRQAPSQSEQQAAGVPAELRENSAVRVANALSPVTPYVTVATPSSTVLWRVASAGIIQRSTDAGSTWALQTSGVVAELVAGSAPSDKVCWITGRAGTILRTTDGGAHWRKIRAPVADDFVAVFAVDAQQATVSSASANQTYKTADAGQTWTTLPNP